MHYIGILSDTHGLLRQEVLEKLKCCEAILHGGDIHNEQVLTDLQKIAPVYAVRGNADKEWAGHLPKLLKTELFGIPIVMIHNKKELPQELGAAKLVIYGHSHKYADTEADGIRFLNPGSCGPRRFHQPVTMALLEIEENGTFTVQKIDIPQEGSAPELKLPEKEQDLRKLVKAVIRDVDRGIPVEKIASDHHTTPELAEQICRMYLTHPGVDIDGILNRIR